MDIQNKLFIFCHFPHSISTLLKTTEECFKRFFFHKNLSPDNDQRSKLAENKK